MAALFINIFITILYCLYLSAYCRGLPTRIEDEEFGPLCSRKCNPSPQDSFSHPQYQCSCSKSCTVYDDCCYDSSFKNTRKSLEHNFACLSVMKQGEFRAVISCPPHRPSDTCRDSLGHLPPVTSTTTNITYGNVFCASCNRDGDNLFTWNVQLRCDSEDENQNTANSIVYDSDGFWKLDEVHGTKTPCKYIENEDEKEVLKDLELRPCRSPEIISSCSPSWTELSVIEKCMSYKNPVYVVDTAYRNPHCAKCNYKNLNYANCIPESLRKRLQDGHVDMEFIRSCMRRSPEDCLLGLHGKGGGRTISSSVNISVSECVPPEGKRCCEGYTYKSGVCRKTRKG